MATDNPTITYSKLLDFPYPLPTQVVEVSPGTSVLKMTLDTMGFTVLKGEQDFQPFEQVQLFENGKLVGIGQVTTYSHNRTSDVTELNFLLLAFNIDGALFCLSAKEVTEDFIKSPAATFLLTGEPREDEDEVAI